MRTFGGRFFPAGLRKSKKEAEAASRRHTEPKAVKWTKMALAEQAGPTSYPLDVQIGGGPGWINVDAKRLKMGAALGRAHGLRANGQRAQS
jgi:hypothetical protein